MSENPNPTATEFELALTRAIGRYTRLRRLNACLGELMTWGAVLSSLGLTACLAFSSLSRFDPETLELVITALAPLPALFLTLSYGLGFNARCAWFDKKAILLKRIYRALKYEDMKPSEASRRWSDIDENLQQAWSDLLVVRQPNMPERPGLKVATVATV